MPRNLVNVFDLKWTPNLAYAIGLITSDGYLAKKTKLVGFCSKEIEMINLYKQAMNIAKKPGRHARGGEKEKKYYYIEFKSKQFYEYLNRIGVTATKSRTISHVTVPDAVFADFFRGLFDGDGTFWTTWDKRWPNSFVYILGISSASTDFINWLKNRLTNLYGVRGYVAKGAGVLTIRYTKRDSKVLFEKMYYSDNLLRLERKYQKIKNALDFDDNLRQNTTTQRAAVAQW